MNEGLMLLQQLVKILSDPKTQQAWVELAKHAVETGIQLRDLFAGEGGAFGAHHRDLVAQFNKRMSERFHAILTKIQEDGIITDAERLELKAAYDELLAGLELIPQ